MKTCLIVSPYFPPSTLAGVHRARHLAKHLPAAGWTPIILCVDERYHEQRLDPGLASLVPPSVEVVKVPALSARSCRTIGIGEISLRAWGPLRRAAMHLLETRSIGAVLITGSPFYPMLLSSEIKRRFSVPVILDFQDPWVSNWGADQPRWSKAGVAYRLAKILEPQSLRASDFVTSVSETQNAEMIARYPWLNAKKMAAIPIGGDPADYDALRFHSVSDDSPVKWEPAQRTLAFVGTFMPRSAPVVEQVLKAFVMARSQYPAVMANVRLLFVGTSNQPNHTTTFRVLPLARAIGVDSGVEEIPQRVPFLDAISVLARSEGILLIGSNEPHYTASKIYPGLMSGRPFLSVFHRASSAHTVLAQVGGGIAMAFDRQDELRALPAKIAEALVKLVINPENLGRADPSAYEGFTAQAVAKRYAEIFDGITSSGSVENAATTSMLNPS
ncbi:MAG: hypothetical protein K2Q28_17290 [Hyphomicrobium sp.]|nr:hypothetical protein [Hyphomicrobium sp.]